MHKLITLLAGCACAISASAADGQQDARAVREQVPFINAEGRQVGTATLVQTPTGVLLAVDVAGLPPGAHALHFHQTGRCDGATGFESAGGHYALRGERHGFEVAGGAHAGDMPNQFVPASGRLVAQVFNPNVSLRSGAAALKDRDGSALIIHAGADDYQSQPSGDAGGRLACAVITPAGR